MKNKDDHFDYDEMDRPYNEANADAVKEKLFYEKELSDAFKRMCLGDENALNEDARVLLNRLKIYCRVITPSFSPDNPHITSFNEGRRDIYSLLMRLLEFDIEDYITIAKETKDE